jgi:sugar phosphate isomerase/epimerase
LASEREVLICGVQFDQELKSGAMTVLDLAPIAKRQGAAGVEYREIWWRDKSREIPAIRDQLSELGLKGTYATFTTLFNRDPAKQRQLLEDLEDARALGSPLMRVFRGEWPGEAPEDAAMREAAQEAIDRAASYNMVLALENFIGPGGTRMEEVKETIESFGSPALRANLDTSNYAINNQDPLRAIEMLQDWIVYCHLKDARESPEGLKATYPGNGILPIAEIIMRLEAIDRHIPICLEIPGEGDPEGVIAKSLEHLAGIR